MAKRAVVWTETAAKQRRGILKYWTKRNKSPAYAKRLIQLIAKQVKIISKYPESFKITDYPDTRESAMGHFSVYYKIADQLLIIVAFWDNRQDPKELHKLIDKTPRNRD